MKKFGLIGYPLTHSFSADYFRNKFQIENIKDCKYQLFPIKSIDELDVILTENPDLVGLNVTIPFKETVIPKLDEIDEIAKKIGAVNTIFIKSKNKNRKLIGFNTDVIGFEKMISPLINSNTKSALVLGNGGSSKSVCFVLEKLGIDFKIISRNPVNELISYTESGNFISTSGFIINTTPLGMFPEVNNYPLIEYNKLSSRNTLIDLIYNPLETVFLKKGKTHGAHCINGLQMLKFQAEASWQLWNETCA